jgi:hypothetical protein
MPKLDLFVPISKIDEEKREVYGVITSSVLDRSKEKLDYPGSKPYIKAWSESVKKDSRGKSAGNVRYMHQLKVAGHLTQINFNDPEQQVEVCAKISDDLAWKQCQEGDLTGFSIGGEYVDVKKVGGITTYIADPTEVSVVDRPCVPNAVFSVVKADGSKVTKRFKHYESVVTPEMEKKIYDAVLKAIQEQPFGSQPSDMPQDVMGQGGIEPVDEKPVSGHEYANAQEHGGFEKHDCGCEKVDDDHQQNYATHSGQKVPKSEHAYAPAGSKPSEWKLPIHDKSHAQNALARENQADIPESDRAAVHARIVAAAKKFGIHVNEDAAKAAEAYIHLTSVPYNEEFKEAIGFLEKTLRDQLEHMEKNMAVTNMNDHLKQACQMCKALGDHLAKGIAGAGSAEAASSEHGSSMQPAPEPASQNEIYEKVGQIVEQKMISMFEKMYGKDATLEKTGATKGQDKNGQKVEKTAPVVDPKFNERYPEHEPGEQYSKAAVARFAATLPVQTEVPADVQEALAAFGR